MHSYYHLVPFVCYYCSVRFLVTQQITLAPRSLSGLGGQFHHPQAGVVSSGSLPFHKRHQAQQSVGGWR
jgi:hypothetical protein